MKNIYFYITISFLFAFVFSNNRNNEFDFENKDTVEQEFIVQKTDDSLINDDQENSSIDSVQNEIVEFENISLVSGTEIEKRYDLKDAFYSLLLPGLGEYRIGRKKLGKSMMVIDALFWSGLAAAFFNKKLIRNDLRAYLYTYASCNGKMTENGKNAWDLSESELEFPLYADSSSYYNKRVYKPSRDKGIQKIDFYWRWQDEEVRQKYYDMWKNSNTSQVIGYYFLAAAITSRVISFINASRFIRNSDISNINNISFTTDISSSYANLNLNFSF